MKEETEEERLQRLSDEEFVRTGSSTFSFNLDIKITEKDMLRDLVNKTEGKNISINKIEEN